MQLIELCFYVKGSVFKYFIIIINFPFGLCCLMLQEKKKWFAVTFILSIVWIAGFSYLMVWWANQTGETIGIPDEVVNVSDGLFSSLCCVRLFFQQRGNKNLNQEYLLSF